MHSCYLGGGNHGGLACRREAKGAGSEQGEIVAALNRQGEGVVRITGLACAVRNDSGRRSAECRFTAHRASAREAHVATFQYVDGWRLLDDRPAP